MDEALSKLLKLDDEAFVKELRANEPFFAAYLARRRWYDADFVPWDADRRVLLVLARGTSLGERVDASMAVAVAAFYPGNPLAKKIVAAARDLDRIRMLDAGDLEHSAEALRLCGIELDVEFLANQKQRMRALEDQEELDARVRELYDDDYDDSYDVPDVDWDQDLTRKYNALTRADDDEAKFWDQTKNTNEAPKKPQEGVQEKNEKLRRKRAEKNKAAIANHHRKDRAARKTAAF